MSALCLTRALPLVGVGVGKMWKENGGLAQASGPTWGWEYGAGRINMSVNGRDRPMFTREAGIKGKAHC